MSDLSQLCLQDFVENSDKRLRPHGQLNMLMKHVVRKSCQEFIVETEEKGEADC